ncbi:hypothetical protein CEUSTIGMA_g3612.t1 [Chlamydomonas eustigma]|uniref:Glycosyl transferase CAP10 domain-containing protein n=1 Tax=Chlamydomonas eustigma TaxID=1157962 RepID=A0A250WZA2_9CHLO|nr:hypothetical protein CEUSTIGMA_g3612.t1 [Chlamydomonas eustigma]|eukprot:GAX76168.1 hypothetical protein CEUSTIGMA_g3612.t1 [Chlamydomonas eustigma]
MMPSFFILLGLLRLLVPCSCIRLSGEEADIDCSQYKPLFSNIDRDLERWKSDGISRALMERTLLQHTTRKSGQKGFAAGFWNGRAYLLDPPNLTVTGHHALLFIVYLQNLVHLQRSFNIPDVDFVISTIDRPLGLNIPPSSKDLPVFRFCKGDSHADILIPIFHFHMKDYDNSILEKVLQNDKKYPWRLKKNKIFGRFSLYNRHVHTQDPSMPKRLGFGGTEICNSTKLVMTCPVRSHFVRWCNQHDDLDIGSGGHIKMLDHAQYKYLVHLDGQGLSSRLDQLLPLNSLVFKEESGYRAFYHHLLEPYEHFIPFWKERPEEILDALKWARENELQAQRIALQAREVALKYLNRRARSCYWFKLLSEFSSLLKYKPEPDPGSLYFSSYIPIDEYIANISSRSSDNGDPALERLMQSMRAGKSFFP